ncbi:MAG: DegT/DnrJ/EryC1/StrS family aminotransferase [Anaerolineae bacterium]|nr:MAG: DegT/DnrJ/EryC1/StrS family aminotransferase [Anaerolineae bacterium]
MRNIPITKPYFGKEELAAIQQPLLSGWVVQGPYVREFETKFSTYVGAKHSVATTSCTTALQIAVAALGLKPGDEVIVPAFTWVSTANVVEYMGATPVFCDIDLATYNLDINQISGLITPRTVGIIPVHLFGLCADMSPILEIAKQHKLWIVEDAACGFGAWYQGKHAGTFGDAGCFSFHPRKSITTGEGGMITTESEKLNEISRSLRDHGASQSDFDRHHGQTSFLLSQYNRLGYNYRMTDIQGALGTVQMDRAEFILNERRNLASKYDAMLSDTPWLCKPIVPEGYVHGYQAYVCLYAPTKPSLGDLDRLHRERNELMQWMESQGVATRQGTHAVVTQGFYRERYSIQANKFPNSVIAEQLSLALPLFVGMTDEEQNFVVEQLNSGKP